MHDALGPNTMLGYCTNVHAGPTYAQTLANLDRHALAVKRRVSPSAPMGVGLWLAEPAVDEIVKRNLVAELAAWLGEHGLLPFTFNGFPQGDFHQPVVKHRVYHPNWADPRRLRYTIALADIQAQLLGDETEGGISTLPVGWRSDITQTPGAIERAADHLVALANHLGELEGRTGKLIHVDIEPEPGCYLDTSADVVALFKDHLLRRGDESRIRRHLRVCHDICHAAVMFEDQADVFARFAAAGIRIGKVQVSSAVRAPFAALDEPDRAAALEQLRQFREPRYLHQTVVAAGQRRFYEDLPDAVASVADGEQAGGEWRVHFHVPLFLQRFGLLQTTQDQVLQCLTLAAGSGDIRHYEAETYAWDVLPDELRTADLAEGIARELTWLIAQSAQSAASSGAAPAPAPAPEARA